MSTIFLIVALFYPRLTLLICYLMDNMPANSTSYETDFIMTIFAPRLLIAHWTIENHESIIWTILFIVAWLFVTLLPTANSKSSN